MTVWKFPHTSSTRANTSAAHTLRREKWGGPIAWEDPNPAAPTGPLPAGPGPFAEGRPGSLTVAGPYSSDQCPRCLAHCLQPRSAWTPRAPGTAAGAAKGPGAAGDDLGTSCMSQAAAGPMPIPAWKPPWHRRRAPFKRAPFDPAPRHAPGRSARVLFSGGKAASRGRLEKSQVSLWSFAFGPPPHSSCLLVPGNRPPKSNRSLPGPSEDVFIQVGGQRIFWQCTSFIYNF